MVHPELTLCIEEGVLAGLVFRSGRKKRVTVGRTRANAFQIKESTVSQKHALIEWKVGGWALRDVGSSNGTFLNGTCLTEQVAVSVSNGDVVSFGPDILVKIRVEQEDGVGEENVEKAEETAATLMTLADWLESGRERQRERLYSGIQSTIEEMKTYARGLQVELCEYAGIDIDDLARVL